VTTHAPTDDTVSLQRDRALRRAFGFGAVARVLSVVASLVVVRLAAHHLGAAGYGVVATLVATAGLVGFADLGVGGGLMSSLAEAYAVDDVTRARGLVSSALVALSAVGLAVAAVLALLAALVPWHTVLGAPTVDIGELRLAVLVAALCVAAGIPGAVGERTLFAQQRGARAGAFTAATAVVTVGGTAVAVAADAPLWAFVLSILGAPAAVAWVETVTTLAAGPDRLGSVHAVRREHVRSLGSTGGLFLGLNLAVAIAYQTDTLVVAAIRGAAAAGVYAVATRMATLLTLPLVGGLDQMWTSIADALARGEQAWVRRRFRQIVVATAAGLVVFGAVVVAAGPFAAHAWVGHRLTPDRAVLAATVGWAAYGMVMTECSYLMNAAHIVRAQLVMAATMAAANVALSVWLTYRIGIAGPAVGSLIAHVCCAGVPTVFIVRRLLRRTA
jgi:O-antigen/teichoic acid export membrane protein